MPPSSWSLQEAKDHFSAVVAAARKAPQMVTKHGKPAVVVVDADEFARLSRVSATGTGSFVEHLLAMPRDDGEFERLGGELRDPEF